MNPRDAASRDLIFGLLALQNGLVDQDVLIAAFRAWTKDKARPIAEILADRGAIDADDRVALEVLAAKHLKRHGGDAGRSLAALDAGRSTREGLAGIGDPDIESTLSYVGSGDAETDDGARPDAASTSSAGATSAGHRFRVLRAHARGGLGAVFVALDQELHREVALKQILDHHADDPKSRTRFVLEAEITGGLEHPGIVPVYGLGSYGDGRPYYAMRFVRGDSLKDAIAAFHADESQKADPGRRSLALRKLLRRFVDVCNAIDYAHTRGVIHRDIKPANVIVGKHGETLVVDWGLAKLVRRDEPGPASDERTLLPSSASGSAETQPGSALGTPAYMGPEQAAGDLDRVGPRSDVYSLGATLYCLLTGVPPFRGDDVGAVLQDVREGRFPSPRAVDPSIDRALEALCLKAMATKPEGRYATPRALADDLDRWAADEPVSAWREPWSRRARRWARRNRTAVAAAAVAMLAGLAGLGGVAAVQARANDRLSRANEDVRRANASLEAEKERVQARFALARDAIRLYHGEVSEDVLLKERRFERLRGRLLRGAAGFYARLEPLLRGEGDRASRLELVRAYYDLGRLTGEIGDKREAMRIHEKALTLGKATVAAFGGGDDATAGMADNLNAIALMKYETGDSAGALAALDEATALVGPIAPGGSKEAGAALGLSQHLRGLVLAATSKTAEALRSYREALATRRQLDASFPRDAKIRSDLAMTLNNLANLLLISGASPEVLRLHDEALAIRRPLAIDHPDEPRLQANLALTHYNIGVARTEMGQFAEAIPPCEESLAIRRRLVDAEPAVTEFRRDLARSHFSIGVALGQTNRWARSLGQFAEALSIQQGLADSNPGVTELRADLANTNNAMAVAREETGDKAGARESYRGAVAAHRAVIAADPTASRSRREMAGSLSNLGNSSLLAGDRVEASRSFDEAVAIYRALADADPANHRCRRDLAECHAGYAETLADLGLMPEARITFGQAIKALDRPGDPGRRDPQDRRVLASIHETIGKVEARLGRAVDALGSYREAVSVRERLAGDHPAEAQLAVELADSLATLGRFQLKSGRPPDALASFRRAVATLETIASPSPNWIYALACFRALAAGIPPGEPAEADRAMGDLRRSLAAGYDDLANLRVDSDLDPLRGRDDFRLLLMDLDFPADPFTK